MTDKDRCGVKLAAGWAAVCSGSGRRIENG